ncbi:WASH complex, subunit CCDC53 [Carpediemonas membranifera]|uniref:WASH complex, subunit CCDC53 n=1 Tax=Carpediemonas membranifera TaxID=201153 RepID=A0A8J6AXZ5_9EUKA|nr:WASH complex, subunit CCDC53 [Carpediemonas membranifera]|eukprot:KAG9394245.1 WASH complex, subunit CCDC53 [Carpediemonas membranifera]
MSTAPLDRERTLAAINAFIISTTYFIDEFARTCHSKLDEADKTLTRTNEIICMLESKLSTVPDEPENMPAAAVEQAPAQASTSAVAQPEAATAAPSGLQSNPEYAMYYRQLKVGIPTVQVFNKMIMSSVPRETAFKIIEESGKTLALDEIL